MENIEDNEKNNEHLSYEYRKVSESIDNLKSLCLIDINAPIHSHRKILGPLIVFTKKCIRKLICVFFMWYIKPVLEQQTEFNSITIETIDLLKYASEKQIKKYKSELYEQNLLIEELKQKNEESVQKIEELKQKNEESVQKIEELKQENVKIFKKNEETLKSLNEYISLLEQITESQTVCESHEKEIYERTLQLDKKFSELGDSIEKISADELILKNDSYNRYVTLDETLKRVIMQNDDVHKCLSDNIESVNIQSHNMFNELSVKSQDNFENINENLKYINKKMRLRCDIGLLNKEIDYFLFEEEFRGDRKKIINKQRQYVEYFKNNKGGEILDIGCGRGEFLEAMTNENINVYGVDIYEPFVDYCKNRGFKVKNEDALTHLNSLEDSSLGGIFMDSVIEHMEDDYMLALLNMAYRKLKTGCYFIIISPNPETFGGLHNFNIDLDHKKPLHYLTLEYLLKKENFIEITRYESSEAEFPFKVTHADGIDFANKKAFNEGMDAVNKYVFGNREYVAIARK